MNNQRVTPWTAEQLITLSHSLGQAYGLGLARKQHSQKQTSARWTPQQLVNLSAARAPLFK